MDKKTRLERAFNLGLPDRPPIMGGWLATPNHIQTLTGCSEDVYWGDPFAWGVQAEQILGSDGVIDIFAPVTRGEFRIVDGQIMEERDHMAMDAVLADIEALPSSQQQLDAFDEEAAYTEFVAEYRAMQTKLGDMLYCPADWDLIPKAIPGWEYGYENAMLVIGMYPDHARKFIDYGVGKGRCQAMLRARAIREGILPRAVFTGEDLCDQRGPMISPQFLRREYFPMLAYVLEPLVEAGAKIVWHCDGNYRPLINDVLACGVAGLQGFQKECGMDLEWIVDLRTRTGDPLLIFGPMSVTKTLPYGSPEDVRAEVDWAMATCRDKASLVIFISNTLTPDIPLQNIQALWQHVLESRW
jgi:hypothetical protein